MMDMQSHMHNVREALNLCIEHKHENGIVQILAKVGQCIHDCEEMSRREFGRVIVSPALRQLYQCRDDAQAALRQVRRRA